MKPKKVLYLLVILGIAQVVGDLVGGVGGGVGGGNRPWYRRPYYPIYCPAGCVYSGYGSNRQIGFRCLDPGGNCPVGAVECCQYDYDCNAC